MLAIEPMSGQMIACMFKQSRSKAVQSGANDGKPSMLLLPRAAETHLGCQNSPIL